MSTVAVPNRARLTINKPKRELTGESEIDPQEENLESLPESEGWDVVPGSDRTSSS